MDSVLLKPVVKAIWPKKPAAEKMVKIWIDSREKIGYTD